MVPLPSDIAQNTDVYTNNIPDEVSEETVAISNSNDLVVEGFIKSSFPLPDREKMYSPYILGEYLTRHHDTIIDGTKITRSKIINYLIAYNLIPVKKTTAYKVEGLASMGLIPKLSTWTDLSKNGRKAILTNREVTFLVDQLKMETKGGESMGSNEIKEKLKLYIQQVYAKKRQLHKLPSTISDHVLNSFVSTVKSQCLFNIYNTVANKTESRRAAEWSLRSTLAYSTIVASTHFIVPLEKPSKYHVKKVI